MFRLDFTRTGQKSFMKLDKLTAQRLLDKLKWLQINAELIIHIPLGWKYKGFYKLRIGDWRIIYQIDHQIRSITIHKVGHRKEIYQ
jgi:mRNA interferase RelE/StbE